MIDVTKMSSDELHELVTAIEHETERREDIAVLVSRINKSLEKLFSITKKGELIDLISNQTGEILAAM